uniref:SURP motif domain-containing protein n=1 Tax=Timspurckia oligopyrenoides TaxID=708627 RepID=A0A7S1ER92_9RHOD|mmetsp:Transcript_1937/g.3450  ORF Transcript_1937/g.3450 Transcript_1937/m.3450 type:complete len:679 (+) Transcript_1937:28-2064(+)
MQNEESATDMEQISSEFKTPSSVPIVNQDDEDGSIGIIIPPLELKSIIEKTAQFVIKNGPAFESKIQETNATNPKFAFLKNTHPYHKFYKSLLQVPLSSLNSSPSNLHANSESDKVEGNSKADSSIIHQQSAIISNPRLSALKQDQISADDSLDSQSSFTDFFSLHTSISHPPSVLELEVIKLCAQSVACAGDSLLKIIRAREERNALFGFLRESHVHHELFTSLRLAYEFILNESSSRKLLGRVRGLEKNRNLELMRILSRVESERIQAVNESTSDNTTDPKRNANDQIDWQDFVLVETLDFEGIADHELLLLPAPVASEDFVAELRRRRAIEEDAARTQMKRDVNLDMDVDGSDTEDQQQSMTSEAVGVGNRKKNGPVADISIPRHQIVPALASLHPLYSGGGGGAGKPMMVKLPSGHLVPMDQAGASVHMELLDPQYKEQKAKAAERQRAINLASDAEVAENLSRLTESRKDTTFRQITGAVTERRPPNAPNASNEALTMFISHGSSQAQSARALATAAAAAATVELAQKKREQLSIDDDFAEDDENHLRKKTKTIENEDTAATSNEIRFEPEEQWIAKYGDSVKVKVNVCEHQNSFNWELKGQTISLEVPLKVSVAALKSTLTKLTKLPVNKMKLQTESAGFLKDGNSLAFYNVEPNSSINLSVKERGGRRKDK